MGKSNLPDAELEVLACLHNLGRNATARELREEMAGYRPMAHGSMATLLGRLEDKGLISKRKGDAGKAFIYTPTKDARHLFRPLLRKLVRRVFGGSGMALVESLFETQPPTPGEMKQLETLMKQLRRKNQDQESAK